MFGHEGLAKLAGAVFEEGLEGGLEGDVEVLKFGQARRSRL